LLTNNCPKIGVLLFLFVERKFRPVEKAHWEFQLKADPKFPRFFDEYPIGTEFE
jgi:hypothetical protein